MLNRVILIGRLTKDPDLRYTPSGTAMASFTLAVDRARPNQEGERETDFIGIVVWGKLGELCAEYLRKGRLAAVDGRLQIRSYENREGQRVRVAEVVAEQVRFLDKAGEKTTSTTGRQADGPDTRSSSGASGKKTSATSPPDPFADDNPFGGYSEDDLPF